VSRWFEQRELRRARALAALKARRLRIFLMEERLCTPQNLTTYLQLKNPDTIRQMLHDGKITEADGWIKIGRLNRFVARLVIARCEAGLFAKGLDTDGKRVARPKLHVA
jgi:hypothetical protein